MEPVEGLALSTTARTFSSPISGVGRYLTLLVLIHLDASYENVAVDDLQIMCTRRDSAGAGTASSPSPPATEIRALLSETFSNAEAFTIVDGSEDKYASTVPGLFSGSAGSSYEFECHERRPSQRRRYLPAVYDPFPVAEDLDGDGATVPFVLSWRAVDISPCMPLSFSAKFASGGSRIDWSDYVLIEVSIDGGPAQSVLTR
eukprot:2005255-Prymnesium_polylepis.1